MTTTDKNKEFETNFSINMMILRNAFDLTQKELAAEIGVNREKIRNWEGRKCCIPLGRAKQLAMFFGYSLEEMSSDIITPNTSGKAA